MIKEGIPHQWSVTIFLCGPLFERGIFRFVLQSFIEGVNSESMSSRLTVCVPEVYTFCVDDIKKSELFNSPSVSLFFSTCLTELGFTGKGTALCGLGYK